MTQKRSASWTLSPAEPVLLTARPEKDRFPDNTRTQHNLRLVSPTNPSDNSRCQPGLSPCQREHDMTAKRVQKDSPATTDILNPHEIAHWLHDSGLIGIGTTLRLKERIIACVDQQKTRSRREAYEDAVLEVVRKIEATLHGTKNESQRVVVERVLGVVKKLLSAERQCKRRRSAASSAI